jgi:hypothetical protein
MANARRKGVKLGRKRVPVDVATIQRMRAEGLSFEAISQQTGLSVGSVFRSVQKVVSV